MLSILIPIYNRNVLELVSKLAEQCKKNKILYEIHCLDDKSRESIRLKNRGLDGMFSVNYVELTENVGRSKIRNRLAKMARYDWLLFLDGDTGIIKRTFIKTYLEATKSHDIINGGRNYQNLKPKTKSKILHWTYGSKQESKLANIRSKYPIRYFHTNNFLIRKELVLDHPFDESLDGYGYEDLSFARTIAEAGHEIKHIDNPTRHLDLITADKFIQNTNNSIINLLHLMRTEKIDNTPLISLYTKLNSLGLTKVYIWVYRRFFEKKVLKNLHSIDPKITLLQGYKLYFLMINMPSKLENE